MTDPHPDQLYRAVPPAGAITFNRRLSERRFGLPSYARHDGPVFEVEVTDVHAVTPADVNPEGELSTAEEDRLIAAKPWELRDARATYWTTREAAEAQAGRELDAADPRLSAEGHGDAMVAAQTRRDETSVWWARSDESPLWKVTVTVREFRQVVESGGGVAVCLRRAWPNDEGRVAVLCVAAEDGSYGCSTGIYADRVTRMSAEGVRSAEERAAEGDIIARAAARASELGEDVATVVAAALARGAVSAFSTGEV